VSVSVSVVGDGDGDAIPVIKRRPRTRRMCTNELVTVADEASSMMTDYRLAVLAILKQFAGRRVVAVADNAHDHALTAGPSDVDLARIDAMPEGSARWSKVG